MKKSPYKQNGVASKTAKKIAKKPLEYSGPKGMGSKGPKKKTAMKELKPVEKLPMETFKKLEMSPMQMNRADKDMMHERELIHDAKGQIHKADKAYKKGDKGKKQEMIHDREMIYDAKTDIHKIDVLKHSRKNRRF